MRKWLRWRWKRWRMGHYTWLAYVDWHNDPTNQNRYRWERLKHRCQELVEEGP